MLRAMLCPALFTLLVVCLALSLLCPLPFPAVRCVLHCLLQCLRLFLPCSALHCTSLLFPALSLRPNFPALPCHITPCHTVFCPILSRPSPYPTLPCPAHQPSLALTYPSLPCLALPYPFSLCPALPHRVLPSPTIFSALPCPAIRSVTHHSSPPSALPWHLPSTLFLPSPYPPTCCCPALHYIVCYAIRPPFSYSCKPVVLCCLPLCPLLGLLCPSPCARQDPIFIFICAILVLPWTQFRT